MGHRLIAGYVDNGSMGYLLSTPNTRVKIALTQGIFFLLSIVFLFFVVTSVTIGFCQARYVDLLNIRQFIMLNSFALLLTSAVSAIAWFFSCLFSDAKYSIGFGAGIPILFFMLNVFAGVKYEYKWIGTCSLYRLFNASEILSGRGNIIENSIVLLTITAGLYTAGIVIFRKKRLAL
jgi:ABC-2 type transport system permease protein